MVNIVGIRFAKAGKIYNFSPAGHEVKKGDYVVVETIRGLEVGKVVLGPKDIDEAENIAPLKDIIRIATGEDMDQCEKNVRDAEEAIPICEEKIAAHKLDMKIIDAEYTFDRNKFIVYFTAEGRVDFRNLVRDMAAIFRTRIELRQIGVRDEAKAVGGLGSCGREVCCKGFLGEFEPVSIQMAKDQSLSLNPTKISGLCGRLMCCLNYECKVYEEKLKKIPHVGTIVLTKDGKGVVVNTDTLKEEVKVRVKVENDMEDIKTYSVDEIKFTKQVDKSYIKEEKEEDIEELSSLEE